jgi:hypothetical protein
MAIALVTANAGTAGTEAGSTTRTLTFTAAAAADETVLLGVSCAGGGAGITGVADNGPGRTWTVDVEEVGSPLLGADVFIIRGVGGALTTSHTVTVTFGASEFVRSIAASIFSDVGTLHDTATDTVVSPADDDWASGAIDIPADGMAFAVAMCESGAVTSTITAPSAELTDFQIASAPTTQTTAYRLGAGTGVTIAGTWSASVQSSIVAASYNPGGGGGGDPEPTAFLKWGGVLVPSVVQTKFGGVLYPGL